MLCSILCSMFYVLRFMFYFMLYYILCYILCSIRFMFYFMLYYILCYILCSIYVPFHVRRYIILLQNSDTQFLLFQMIAFHCSQYWSLVSPLLFASLSPNDWGKWDTAIHDGIVPLPWKQAKFNLWAFCSLSRREQSLIVQIFGFIWFVNFELRFANQESLTLPQVTLNSFSTIKYHQD